MIPDKRIFDLLVLKYVFDRYYGPCHPTELIWFIISFIQEPLVQIICDLYTTIILHKPTGVVYACGSNYCDQFGISNHQLSSLNILRKIMLLTKIKTIAMNTPILFAYDVDDNIYSWGLNRSEISSSPKLIISEEHLPGTISQGSNYNLYLCKNGNLYIRGDNVYMGIKPNHGLKRIEFPRCSPNFKSIQIGSVRNNSFVLTTDGLYGWGENKCGQLGLGDTTDYDTPIKINMDSVVIFSIGQSYIIVLDKNNDVWVWGYNACGQLGLGDTISRNEPQKHSLQNIISVVCGTEHTLALKLNGDMYSWGDNVYGQLGLGNTSYKCLPQKLELKCVISIMCGSNHTVAVDADNKIWVWGMNNRGQLGLGDEKNRFVPQLLEFKF